MKSLKLLLVSFLFCSFAALAQNPRIENGVAIYHADKNIGRKFNVPDSWDKILIKENVTITGSFFMPNRNHPIEIAGESRKTSIIQGDGSRPTDDGINGRTYSAIRCDKSPDLYVHDLFITKPMKFHIHGGFGNVTVERCDIIAGSETHTTDGIHGGREKTVVKDCYIDVYDDALYTIECKLIENTTIVHNKNGGPFMTSWGASVPSNHTCIIRNCTVIDNYDQTNYNHGVFSWAGKSDNGQQTIHNKIEGTFTHLVNPGKIASPMYTIGRPNDAGISDAVMKIDGTCLRQNSVDTRLSKNSEVIFVNCDGNTGGGETPTDITNLSLSSPSCTSVSLTWGDVQGEEQYRIRRALAGTGTYEILGDVAAGTTTYTDATALESTAYDYMVRPMVGGVAVAVSNVPSITTESCGTTGGGGGNTSCRPEIDFPGGRIALTFDGNEHDEDDIGAMPISIAMIEAAGLIDKVVFMEHSNHHCNNQTDQHEDMIASAQGCINRFGLNASVVYDYQTQRAASTAAFAAAINASTANNKLWIIAAGPMESLWRALNAANASARQHVVIISHSMWNQNHGDCGANSHTWADCKNDFPEPFYTESCNQTGNTCSSGDESNPNLLPDQNTSNNNNDFETPASQWSWLQNSNDADLAWIYTRDKADGPGGIDVSDAGMVYYLITGAHVNGGNERAGWPEAKDLLENPCSGNTGGENCTNSITLNGINDFNNLAVSGFAPAYEDGARGAIAVNSVQHGDAWAAARTTFTGVTGTYDITLTTLTEIDGESNYRMLVNGNLVGTFQNPVSATDYAPATKKWTSIMVNNGDQIQVEFQAHTNGTIPEGDGTAYARGRWTDLAFTCSGTTGGGTGGSGNCTGFEEKDGLLIVEMENTNFSGNWKKESVANGYTGDGYIVWRGSNSFNNTENGIIEIPIKINTTGTYIMRWRMAIKPEYVGPATEHNDSWLKIEADNYYAVKNTSKIKPKPECNNAPNYGCAEGSTLNGFFKMFGGGTNANWQWQNKTSDFDDHFVQVDFNSPGEYKIIVAARSEGHLLDRIILFKEGTVTQSNAQDLANAETGCTDTGTGGGNEGPTDITDLVAEARFCTEVELTWSDVDNETGYRVRRKVTGEAVFTNIGDVAANETYYIDETADGNTDYIYMVRPLKDGVAVANSNQVEVTTDLCNVTSISKSTKTNISLYPNPVHNQVNLSQTSNWKLFSALGELLDTGIGEEIDLSNFNSGMYILEVENTRYPLIKD